MVKGYTVAVERLVRFASARPNRFDSPTCTEREWAGGVILAEIVADHDGRTFSGVCTKTQPLSAELHASTDLDGIAYRSRLEPDQLCVALFDRADHEIEMIEEGEPIDGGWIERLL